MRRPPRRCACGLLVAAGSLCICQQRRKAEADKRRQSAPQRGYDHEYNVKAKAFLSRPENQFCECGRKAVLVRHRISIRKRSDLRLREDLWLPGCSSCNAKDAWRDRNASEQAT